MINSEDIKSNIDDYYFVFGGCYSNFQATQKIQEIANNYGFKPYQIICTGDVVGYCAQPEETVQLIKSWGINCIAGNVEVQLRTGEVDCGCNFESGSRCDTFSLLWFPFSQQHLSSDAIDWMQGLSTEMQFDINGKKVHVLHGGTDNISEFIFASTPVSRKLELFEETASDIILAGHAGLPFIQKVQNQKGDIKLWINPGVIGMPANDGSTRCWYGIFNIKNFEAAIFPFDYDFQAASDLMLKHGLPEPYAHTLRTGIWDNCEILPEEETQNQGKRFADVITP